MKKPKRQRIHLRTERRKKGLSAHQVYEKTKIPLRYIEALETGNMDSVQKGSRLLEARMRYLNLLGLPLDSKISFKPPQGMYEGTETTGNIVENGLAKKVAVAIIAMMVLVVCIKLASIVVDGMPTHAMDIVADIQNTSSVNVPDPTPAQPINDLVLRATGYAKATIIVDGVELHNDLLQPRKKYTFDFNDQLEIWTDNVSLLEIDLKGDRISPQGAVANERKLIFSFDRDVL